VTIEIDVALERALSEGDEWASWRALRLSGERLDDVPTPPMQDPAGGFMGPGGRLSPGATGEALCHLKVVGAADSGVAATAADWLEEARTPARAWLDAPDEVPGHLDTYGGGRVWATASAACGLLALGRGPEPTALNLLRGEGDLDGRFTGGAYPTFAAAGAWWLAEGPRTEIAEWALRWAREAAGESWGPWERATALTFWAAAGIPQEHPSVELFLDELREGAPVSGWKDLDLTLRTLELVAWLEG
jgi:hypothetical protein